MVTIDRIRVMAKERDITMNSICRKIGKGTSYFADKESAKKEVPDDILGIISERLNTTVAYLKGETDEKKPTPVSEGGHSDDELVRMWKNLTPDEILRVKDFAQGMIANRKEPHAQ